jgi:hypothetical protein
MTNSDLEIPKHKWNSFIYVGKETIYMYIECNRRNGPNFGRVFLMLKYTEKTQNTYVQS